MQQLRDLRTDLKALSDPVRAQVLQRFFKTGKGEYGEGDIFLGITVPVSRKLAMKYKDLPLPDIKDLLYSKIHEERMIALLILIHAYKKGDEKKQQEVFDFYISNTNRINNWDLVDLSAGLIVGTHLLKSNSREILNNLALSQNLWERRIAMVSTYAFISRGETEWTFRIAEKLLADRNDLIQKAVGWMLREAGKRCSQPAEEEFLLTHYKKMGRTALRYAIERFDEKRRKQYLLGEL